MQNKTYEELYELISALAGITDFTSEEEAQILAMANRRLYQAYRATQMWPRYVVGAEPRLMEDSVIPLSFTPVSQVISAATRSGDTVTATLSAEPHFTVGMTVTVAGLTGSEDPNGAYKVVSLDGNDFSYKLDSGTGDETYGGSGTVIAAAQSDVGSFIRVWGENPFGRTGSRQYDYWVDVDGCHVVNAPETKTDFWIAYVKEWDGPYNDAATTIPLEFFNYAAHATYADYLRMDRQNDKAIAEEGIAQQYLLIELDRAQQANVNTIWRRITTHLSSQSR